MVVDRFAAVTAEYTKQVQGNSISASAATKTSGSTQTKQTAEDTTSFNSATDSVQALSKAAVEATPARQAKVEALRQAVNSGQYQPDSTRIAKSIADSV